jgi:hypothetical protein
MLHDICYSSHISDVNFTKKFQSFDAIMNQLPIFLKVSNIVAAVESTHCQSKYLWQLENGFSIVLRV